MQINWFTVAAIRFVFTIGTHILFELKVLVAFELYLAKIRTIFAVSFAVTFNCNGLCLRLKSARKRRANTIA